MQIHNFYSINKFRTAFVRDNWVNTYILRLRIDSRDTNYIIFGFGFKSFKAKKKKKIMGKTQIVKKEKNSCYAYRHMFKKVWKKYIEYLRIEKESGMQWRSWSIKSNSSDNDSKCSVDFFSCFAQYTHVQCFVAFSCTNRTKKKTDEKKANISNLFLCIKQGGILGTKKNLVGFCLMGM